MSTFPSDARPVIISGPSGVGKGTLYTKLLERHPTVFSTSISHTTRGPRPGEEDGVHYYFVSHEKFEEIEKSGGFVEHAKFGGNRYGTSKAMIEEKMDGKGKEGKRVVVLDIEMEGVKQIHAHPSFSCRYVFISPPSSATQTAYEVLEARLRGRGTEKEESIQKRLQQAKLEMEYAKQEGVHDVVIVNDDLEKAYAELEDFVFGRGKFAGAKDAEKAGESVRD